LSPEIGEIRPACLDKLPLARSAASHPCRCGIAAQINSPEREILELTEARAYFRLTLHCNME